MSNEPGPPAPKRRTSPPVLLVGGAFVLGAVVLAVAAIQVWEWSNSVWFCANMCHDVHPEEIGAYEDSYHARVKCVECHMGRVGTLHNMALKATHFQHVPAVLFGRYGRPLIAETMRPANESCERCHWPPAFHGDTIREITNFAFDEASTQTLTYLILKTGSGTRTEGMGFGIHWHVSSRVEYIADDEQAQRIRWVGSVLPDGRTVEYNDVTDPLSAEEIASAEKHVMDCVDCHNRMGHPFPTPEDLVSRALVEGRLSRDLPYIAREITTLVSDDHPDPAEAQAAVESWKESYRAAFPSAAANQAAEIDQAAEVAAELMTQLVFAQPGISWRSFPNHTGHDEFAGCFRCHDGKHLSEEGESIRLHCNICHSVPVTTPAGGDPPSLPAASLQEPESHLETNFMADHRFLANGGCAQCHGEVQFGSDDSSFCAISACHGRAWPEVELNAAFPHPIALEGGHADVLCHDCHDGAREMEYRCANCHQPAMQPHFGEVCEDCHTTEGWQQADLGDFQHPIPLEEGHADLACSACHTAGVDLTYRCADCHEPPREPHFGPNCELCHDTAGFEGATLPEEMHPVPLTGAHARATCNVCHAEGQRVPEYVCSNCHRPPQNHPTESCDLCHTPEGWAQSAASLVASAPVIPHRLEERDDCFECHEPASLPQTPPIDHNAFPLRQCTLCHKSGL